MSQESRQKWLNCEDDSSKKFLEKYTKEDICKLFHRNIFNDIETEEFIIKEAEKVLSKDVINNDDDPLCIENIVEILVSEIIKLRNGIQDRDWYNGVEKDLLN